jgi:FKBP-type peptidyl-prolyl cis-trans isomerase FkpA
MLLLQCNSTNDQPHNTVTDQQLKEPLINANKTIIELESSRIDRYVERRKWKVITSGTGLRYFIYEKGTGALAEDGMRAKVHYEVKLLDGTLCYTSDGGSPKEFLIGRDQVESGIHEGITYMHVGDRAKFILPSHLAHGLTGDQHKIPPRSILVVDLHLLALN